MTILDIKRLAKELKKQEAYASCSHCQILNEIVRSLGYNSWNHYCAAIKE